MDFEKKSVKLLISNTNQIEAELRIYEEAPEDVELVLLELSFYGEIYKYTNENFFYALQSLRKDLVAKGVQILCNGAARNVYPSTMQLSMGYGQTALDYL